VLHWGTLEPWASVSLGNPRARAKARARARVRARARTIEAWARAALENVR